MTVNVFIAPIGRGELLALAEQLAFPEIVNWAGLVVSGRRAWTTAAWPFACDRRHAYEQLEQIAAARRGVQP